MVAHIFQYYYIYFFRYVKGGLLERLPITPHCGFLIAASQLEKSYVRMKVMCGSHASLRSSVSSHPTFPRCPGRTLHVSIYNKKG